MQARALPDPCRPRPADPPALPPPYPAPAVQQAGAAAATAQVFDLRNKLVAGSAPVEPPVRWIATPATGVIDIGGCWAVCCACCQLRALRSAVPCCGARLSCAPHFPPSPMLPRLKSPPAAAPLGHRHRAGDAGGGVVRLSERPLADKLEALFRTRAYPLALAVAEAEQVRLRSRPCAAAPAAHPALSPPPSRLPALPP